MPDYARDYARGGRHEQTQWQYDHWKAKDAKRQRKGMVPSCCDGRMMKGIEPPKQFMARQKNTCVTWTPSRLLTYYMSQHGKSAQDTKIILRWESTMDHYQDREDFDLIFQKQLARLQPSSMNKDR